MSDLWELTVVRLAVSTSDEERKDIVSQALAEIVADGHGDDVNAFLFALVVSLSREIGGLLTDLDPTYRAAYESKIKLADEQDRKNAGL